MAIATAQCLYLSCSFKSLSLSSSSSSSKPLAASFKPLSSSSSISFNPLSTGFVNNRRVGRSVSIVCEGGKKPDSAAKRARQAEKRRLYNKARKSEVRTRMKKVLEELEVLRKKTDAQPEEVIGIEKLIAEAYSVIDKAIQVGTLHKNTGARRKSRLARRKKAVEILHGWYAPEPAAAAACLMPSPFGNHVIVDYVFAGNFERNSHTSSW